MPALSKLGYLPIRADNQTGSVIITDMLEQLVHADPVLADISILNGNVYYEAGVRHGARETGHGRCVIWSKPLFDLDQITHLPCPFPAREPEQADYRAIEEELTKRIPGLVDSAGPVFTQISGANAFRKASMHELQGKQLVQRPARIQQLTTEMQYFEIAVWFSTISHSTVRL